MKGSSSNNSSELLGTASHMITTRLRGPRGGPGRPSEKSKEYGNGEKQATKLSASKSEMRD